MSDMQAAVSWYIAITAVGWSALPIAWRIFHRFTDRGFSMIRALGLLAVAYGYWLGSTLDIVPNSAAGVLGVWLLLPATSVWLLRGDWSDLIDWLRDNRRTVLLMEGLFLLLFAGWAYVRSFSPEIVGTEKPMELAFLNSVLESPQFPPHDPWLSGYAISYYYFGFIMMGAVTKVTGVASGVAFNLTSAVWFAMTALGAYGVVFNLIGARRGKAHPMAALLGPLFVTITGNLEGFLEMLHTRGAFWTGSPESGMTSTFWRWLDIKDLVNPQVFDGGWIPQRNWWWWRASRVVRDVNLAGADVEVIDEFPAFSFILADNHPHVLALPFVLLAIAFAFHVYLRGERKPVRLSDLHRASFGRPLMIGGGLLLALLLLAAQWSGAAAANGGPLGGAAWVGEVAAPVVLGLGGLAILVGLLAGWLPSALPLRTFILAAWIFGSLAFLNVWDLPIYSSLMGLVMLWALRSRGWTEALKAAAATGVGLLVAGVLFYLPWYPTFSSQAGGILPNVAFPTKIQHFVVMFAPLFVPLSVWMGRRLLRNGKPNLRLLLGLGLGLPLAMFLLSFLLAGAIAAALEPPRLAEALGGLGASDLGVALDRVLGRRLRHMWTSLLLGVTVAAAAHLLLVRWNHGQDEGGAGDRTPQVWPFVVMLGGVGGLLVLGPEFLYIKDLFGTRMNTVFKFYYAAWILWGVAAAYATYELWPDEESDWTGRLRALVVLPLVLGLFYPVMALHSRTAGGNTDRMRTLDGTAHLSFGRPEDKRAIEWINRNLDDGILAEAVGGSYTQYARIATHTGLKTVLGWDFHEIQWRGNAEPQGSRRADIERLYTTSDWGEAQKIVQQYGIEYVYVGPLERSTYGVIREAKFNAFMRTIYQDGPVVIYEVTGTVSAR